MRQRVEQFRDDLRLKLATVDYAARKACRITPAAVDAILAALTEEEQASLEDWLLKQDRSCAARFGNN